MYQSICSSSRQFYYTDYSAYNAERIQILKYRIIYRSILLCSKNYWTFFLISRLHQFKCASSANGYRHYYFREYYHISQRQDRHFPIQFLCRHFRLVNIYFGYQSYFFSFIFLRIQHLLHRCLFSHCHRCCYCHLLARPWQLLHKPL